MKFQSVKCPELPESVWSQTFSCDRFWIWWSDRGQFILLGFRSLAHSGSTSSLDLRRGMMFWRQSSMTQHLDTVLYRHWKPYIISTSADGLRNNVSLSCVDLYISCLHLQLAGRSGQVVKFAVCHNLSSSQPSWVMSAGVAFNSQYRCYNINSAMQKFATDSLFYLWNHAVWF